MRSLDATQTAILAADVKTEVSWLFEIDRTGNGSIDDYWSTKEKTWDGNDYTFKVLDFSPVTMQRNRSEYGIQSPSSFSFTITNKDSVIRPVDYGAGNVTLRLVVAAGGDEAEIASWSYDIITVSPAYQKITFECRDWVAKYLEGVYPNTPLVHHLWPTNEQGEYDNCVPLIFGTCYIPVISAYITTDRFYILGPAAPTYTVTKARSPQEIGNVVEWVPASTTFTQSTKVGSDGLNYKVVQVIGADANADGTPESNVVYQDGSTYYPLSFKYSRSDLVSYTSPADVIDYILQDFGIPSSRIDATTLAAVKATYAGWSLTWNVGLYNQEDRKTLLARLCQNCALELIIRDKIYFKTHTNAVQKEITADLILDGSFDYRSLDMTGIPDCGYVIYPHVSGDVPVTNLVKVLIPAKTTTAVQSDIEVDCSYVPSSENAQRLGIMSLQRSLLAGADISFRAKGKCLNLEPDDALKITGDNYGSNTILVAWATGIGWDSGIAWNLGNSFNVLIDSITINKDLSVEIAATKYNTAINDWLNDWTELSPSAVVPGVDNTTNAYKSVVSGPDSDANVITDVLRISDKVGFSALVGGGTDWRIWAGATLANRATAPFRVDDDGNFFVTQVQGLSAPDASGEAIRQTAKITEASLESAVDLKHAAVTLSAAADFLLALSGQEIGLDTQTANLIFAGPASGAAAAPTFRAMVRADVPTDWIIWRS